MSIGRKKLIAKLEGKFFKNIYNNKNQIRYPITFKNGSKLKGRYILDVNNSNKDYFYSGHYVFGANKLYIYKAIDSMLQFLESEDYDIEIAIDSLSDNLS